ncbi:DegT/DnrJ/EryC1/StrS family aminotransferase [Paenibacillus dendritiformis]|uniref:DegT/DnrJ/EryC1/StrS family aminotransferase n=1 Tax=Paenibacillus dendritiformis TaxID=130049 RepID=UPI0030B89C15
MCTIFQCNKQPYYQRLGYDTALCPNAETYYRTAMSIPIFPKMSEGDIEQSFQLVKRYITGL